MVQYDSAVIRKFADKLYAQAKSVVVVHSILGFVLGCVGTVLLLGALKSGLRMPELLIGGAIGMGIGFATGQGRAFGLRLQAQVALCQAEIELNTRQARSTAPAPLP